MHNKYRLNEYPCSSSSSYHKKEFCLINFRKNKNSYFHYHQMFQLNKFKFRDIHNRENKKKKKE